jgi:hypothetical protein
MRHTASPALRRHRDIRQPPQFQGLNLNARGNGPRGVRTFDHHHRHDILPNVGLKNAKGTTEAIRSSMGTAPRHPHPCGNPVANAGVIPRSSEGIPMADDPTKKGMQDRTRINAGEDYELRYWSEKFGVSQDQLKAAVKKVGSSVAAVEKELKAA